MRRDTLTVDLFAEPEPPAGCATCVHVNLSDRAPTGYFGACTPHGWRKLADPACESWFAKTLCDTWFRTAVFG